MSNLVVRPYPDLAFDDHMRLHDSPRSDLHPGADAGEGTNFHILVETGIGIDEGG